MTKEEVLYVFKRATELECNRFEQFLSERDNSKDEKDILRRIHMMPITAFLDALMEAMETPRGFEVAEGFKDIKLPVRSTMASAGYDFFAASPAEIMPGETAKIDTGVKAYMGFDEVLKIYPRSSYGIKRNLMLANSTGIIDSDYYENPDNDGHIIIALHNYGPAVQKIEVGDKIAQGIFSKFLDCGDEPEAKRTGGIGSTDVVRG